MSKNAIIANRIMIGFVLIYFVGKYFAELAFEYEKNRWLFAILGIVSYYACILLAGLLIGTIIGLSDYDISKINDLVLGLLCIPFGALGCWGFYKFLKYKWSNEARPNEKLMQDEQIIDDQLID